LYRRDSEQSGQLAHGMMPDLVGRYEALTRCGLHGVDTLWFCRSIESRRTWTIILLIF
jgi:hypothetical protein